MIRILISSSDYLLLVSKITTPSDSLVTLRYHRTTSIQPVQCSIPFTSPYPTHIPPNPADLQQTVSSPSPARTHPGANPFPSIIPFVSPRLSDYRVDFLPPSTRAFRAGMRAAGELFRRWIHSSPAAGLSMRLLSRGARLRGATS